MGMAEEVKASQDNKRASAPALMQAAPEAAPEIKKEPVVEVTKEEAAPETIIKKEVKIKIGDKEFSNQEEALEYARDLDAANSQEQAYIKGHQDATTKSQPKGPTIEEKVGELLFDDPKEALKLYKEDITKNILATIKSEEARKTNEVDMWKGFFKKYPDLSGQRKTAEYIMNTNWDQVAHINKDKGLEIVASKTRELLKNYSESQVPETELKNSSTEMASVSGEPVPAPQQPVEKTLDFVSQVNNLRKRRQ